jgi:Ice-binding-like
VGPYRQITTVARAWSDGPEEKEAVRHFSYKVRFLGLAIPVLLAGMWPMAAQAAATAPALNSAGSFAVLSAAPGGGGAVTCTNGTITGNVGSSGLAASVVQTSCTINGNVIAPVSAQVVSDFNNAYAAYAAIPCDQTLTGTLAGVTLTPGVYCFAAAAAPTGTLTLNGPSTATWIFKIGAATTPPTGALTGTNFSVVMAGGGTPCNVNWWVAQAATMTDSQFVGTILAGAAITLKRGTFSGNALAGDAVTVTGTTLVGCAGTTSHGKGKLKEHCNQGVGNGPEGCDPGNSNQGNPARSNDELGGTPGDPGRQGGNGKQTSVSSQTTPAGDSTAVTVAKVNVKHEASVAQTSASIKGYGREKSKAKGKNK